MKRFVLSCFAGIALCSLASASITPNLVSVSPSGSNFAWTYSATLSVDQRICPPGVASCVSSGTTNVNTAQPSGTFFTIYDISGLVSSLDSAPTGWTMSVQMLGLTPNNITAPDSSTISNVSFIYTGTTTISPPGGKPGTSPVSLGNFVIGSNFGLQKVGFYTAQATKNTNDMTDGTLATNFGSVPVPTGVPEPASMVLIGSGLVGIALFRRKLIRR